MKSDDQIKQEFGKRLVQAMELAGYPNDSQLRNTLARRYGVTVENARKWVSGLSMPTISKMAIIAEDLNVDAAWLMAGQGEPLRLPKALQDKEANPALTDLIQAYELGGDTKREVLRLVAELPEEEMGALLLVLKSIAAKY